MWTGPAAEPLSAARGRSVVRDPPDPARAIVGHEHRAVLQHGEADRAAPHLGRVLAQHPADEKVFVATFRAAVAERHEHDLVAGAPGTVRRSAERNERAAAVP